MQLRKAKKSGQSLRTLHDQLKELLLCIKNMKGLRVTLKLLIIYAMLSVLMASCTGKQDYPSAPLRGNDVVINTSSMKEGAPVFYSFHKEGRRVDFFVVMVDGVPSAYLDACRKCGPKKKGFRFVDGKLLCLACGEGYSIREIEGVGNCHPISLSERIEGNNLIIEEGELLGGLAYF